MTAANARRAATDPNAVYYIGEFDSGASEIAVPILNLAGIPTVSPGSTYVGLTAPAPGDASGEPGVYYQSPHGRTFMRLVPSDLTEAAAALRALFYDSCGRVALVSDGSPAGNQFAALVGATPPGQLATAGVQLVRVPMPTVSTGPALATWARAQLTARRVTCVLLSGVAGPASEAITRAALGALPPPRNPAHPGGFAPPKILGTDGLCTPAWGASVAPAQRALLQCVQPVLALARYAANRGGRAFLAAYARAYPGAPPDPYAAFGYEAMELGLQTIATLGHAGDSRSALLTTLRATTDRASIIGSYGFDRAGDTSLNAYGLYAVGADGTPYNELKLAPLAAPQAPIIKQPPQ